MLKLEGSQIESLYLLTFEAEWAPSGGRPQAQARPFRGLYSAPGPPQTREARTSREQAGGVSATQTHVCSLFYR